MLLFVLGSVLAYNQAGGQKESYRAQSLIAFSGKEASFNVKIEADRIRDDDFLKRLAKTAPGLNANGLKSGFEVSLTGPSVAALSFVSDNRELARDAVNSASLLFIEEREKAIKAIRSQRRDKLALISAGTEPLKDKLSLIQKKLVFLKEKNAPSDARRSELRKKLDELNLQKAQLLNVYTEQHPEVTAVQEKINLLDSEIAAIPDMSRAYQGLNADMVKVQSAISAKENQYQKLSELFKEEGEPWRAELKEPAKLPVAPVGRARKAYLAWGIAAAFLFSLLCSIVFEALDRRIYSREEIEQKVKIPVISEMCRTGQRDLLRHSNNPDVLKAFEQLYTFLKVELFRGALDNRVVLITSAEQRTGKSFLALNLALSAAKNGQKVLLIDANFRNPSINRIFRFSKESKGFSDLLQGSITHPECVHNLTDLLLTGSVGLAQAEKGGFDNLKIILSGTISDNPLGILDVKSLSGALKQLSKVYGLIIIDSAALKNCADTVNFMPLADAVIISAVKARTTYPALRGAVAQIRKINAPLTGVIFTSV